jgi:hypothetical protein
MNSALRSMLLGETEMIHCRSVLGLVAGIVVSWGVAAGADDPPQSVLRQPDNAPHDAAAIPVPEDPYWDHGADCTGVDERRALVRWWQDRAKPVLQYTHWGYPEYFEETPFGTSVRANQRAQISSGVAARLVLYQYDFCDGGVTLNPSGQRRLKDLATGFDCWSHHRLLIEATPERPQLAVARRNHVTKMLHDSGIPAQVEVGTPTGFMPMGDEALLMNINLLRQVRSGGGSVGMPTGGGGGGAQPSGNGGGYGNGQ